MSVERQHATQSRRDLHAPERILLCLHEDCAGDFYYPLSEGESQSCPVDGRHPVKVYRAERVIEGDPDV